MCDSEYFDDRISIGHNELNKIDIMKYIKDSEYITIDFINALENDFPYEMSFLNKEEFIVYLTDRYKGDIVTDEYYNLYFPYCDIMEEIYEDRLEEKYKKLDSINVIAYLYTNITLNDVFESIQKENPDIKKLKLSIKEFDRYMNDRYSDRVATKEVHYLDFELK